MRPFMMVGFLIFTSAVSSGCSVLSGEDLSKDSFHGTIKYAVVRPPAPDSLFAPETAKN